MHLLKINNYITIFKKNDLTTKSIQIVNQECRRLYLPKVTILVLETRWMTKKHYQTNSLKLNQLKSLIRNKQTSSTKEDNVSIIWKFIFVSIEMNIKRDNTYQDKEKNEFY